jgi:hypothetical protein
MKERKQRGLNHPQRIRHDQIPQIDACLPKITYPKVLGYLKKCTSRAKYEPPCQKERYGGGRVLSFLRNIYVWLMDKIDQYAARVTWHNPNLKTRQD